MQTKHCIISSLMVFLSSLAVMTPASAVTGIQVGPSGKTYASIGIQCGLHPVQGMAPFVQAGLYNPKRNATATVSLNGTPTATVSFISPDATVWLDNQINPVAVELTNRTKDTYTFDATSAQINICIPDTRANTISGDLETGASGKSSATIPPPGCAWNPTTGTAQPYVNVFDEGTYLLNVLVNNVPLTQLSATRPHTPVFLSAGWNVISVANGALSTDYFVRDGGTGTCSLP